MTSKRDQIAAMTLDPACRPLRLEFVTSYSVEDELVLYAPDRGQAVSLNRSAGAIWNLCDGERSLMEITGLLAEWSGYPTADILVDVLQAITRLQQDGLVELRSPAI